MKYWYWVDLCSLKITISIHSELFQMLCRIFKTLSKDNNDILPSFNVNVCRAISRLIVSKEKYCSLRSCELSFKVVKSCKVL